MAGVCDRATEGYDRQTNFLCTKNDSMYRKPHTSAIITTNRNHIPSTKSRLGQNLSFFCALLLKPYDTAQKNLS